MDVLEIKTDAQVTLEVKDETDIAVIQVESTSQGAPGRDSFGRRQGHIVLLGDSIVHIIKLKDLIGYI